MIKKRVRVRVRDSFQKTITVYSSYKRCAECGKYKSRYHFNKRAECCNECIEKAKILKPKYKLVQTPSFKIIDDTNDINKALDFIIQKINEDLSYRMERYEIYDSKSLYKFIEEYMVNSINYVNEQTNISKQTFIYTIMSSVYKYIFIKNAINIPLNEYGYYSKSFNAANKNRAFQHHTGYSFVNINYLKIISKSRLCPYCLEEMAGKESIDHIIALANGGYHEENNIINCCLKCNCAKNSLPVTEFLNNKLKNKEFINPMYLDDNFNLLNEDNIIYNIMLYREKILNHKDI